MLTILGIQVKINVQSILILSGALLGLIVLLFVGLWYYRRWFLSKEDTEEQTEAWTLQDLRRMKAEGKISEEEFQALREAMLAGFRKKEVSEPNEKNSP